MCANLLCDKCACVSVLYISLHAYTYIITYVLLCLPKAGISDKISHEMAEKILIEMGEFFQIQVRTYINKFSL